MCGKIRYQTFKTDVMTEQKKSGTAKKNMRARQPAARSRKDEKSKAEGERVKAPAKTTRVTPEKPAEPELSHLQASAEGLVRHIVYFRL